MVFCRDAPSAGFPRFTESNKQSQSCILTQITHIASRSLALAILLQVFMMFQRCWRPEEHNMHNERPGLMIGTGLSQHPFESNQVGLYTLLAPLEQMAANPCLGKALVIQRQMTNSRKAYGLGSVLTCFPCAVAHTSKMQRFWFGNRCQIGN